ncbi:MAG: glutaminyl-peptide cyclotransferase [Pseudomonadota bacterium]|nr:glutaminyl-peptide cyclotransferase [Pseudomonadota bacterium]
MAGATVVARYPHDRAAFTEGLFWSDGYLYESTGMEGQSDIRRVRLADGKVLARAVLSPTLFGEGIAPYRGEIVSMTWRTGIGFRWARDTLKKTATFRYPGEGWGLAETPEGFVQSDGSAVLRFRDPATFAEKRTITVTLADGTPVVNLNEVEWVKGDILANIWETATIARIDPATGHIKALIDLRPLRSEVGASGTDAVLNGIAYDAKGDRLFVTGKNWRTLFQIKMR